MTRGHADGGSISRRDWLCWTGLGAASLGLARLGVGQATADERPAARVGIVTDVHHADLPPRIGRHYRDSLAKLEVAMDIFVQEEVEAIVHLGDLIDGHETADGDEASVEEAAAKLHATGLPLHFAMGNHCLETLSKPRFAELTGARQGHFSFDVGGVRFVVLDPNYKEDGTPYEAGNFHWTNCHIPPAQLEWLEQTLAEAEGPAIVLSHQRLDPEPNYQVANHDEVRRVIGASGRAKAVLQGHYHRNHLERYDNVPYVVLRGMVEGAGLESNGYSIVEAYTDGRVTVRGFAEQQSYTF